MRERLPPRAAPGHISAMRSLAVLLSLVTLSLFVGCGGVDDPCVVLEEKCERCSNAPVRSTCEQTVRTKDDGQCEDRLEDPDVVKACK